MKGNETFYRRQCMCNCRIDAISSAGRDRARCVTTVEVGAPVGAIPGTFVPMSVSVTTGVTGLTAQRHLQPCREDGIHSSGPSSGRGVTTGSVLYIHSGRPHEASLPGASNAAFCPNIADRGRPDHRSARVVSVVVRAGRHRPVPGYPRSFADLCWLRALPGLRCHTRI